MKHFIIIALLIIASTLAIHAGLEAIGLLPVQASTQAISIDQLFGFYSWGIAFFFSLIIVILLYSLVVFRRRKGETGDGVPDEGNTTLEISWTAIPLLIVLVLAYFGARSLSDTRRIDPSAMVVKVIAQQWNFQFQYPQYLFASKDLYLPVGQQVDLQMTSLDVLHSFFVPEFRLKQDIVPGRTVDLRVTPSKIGHYHVQCSQLCGRLHAQMVANVYVVSQQDFTAWVNQQVASAPKDPVLIGQQLASLFGCATCHSTDGSKKIGPTWSKLFNSTVTLADGTTVKADENYIHTSIVDPNKQIVKGYQPNVMPATFAKALTEDQIKDLIAYIKTLK
jgi:cytochrome c oxidase subunit 2